MIHESADIQLLWAKRESLFKHILVHTMRASPRLNDLTLIRLLERLDKPIDI